MSSSESVAIVFDDMTEFLCVKNSLDDLIHAGVDVDIYVASSYSKDLENDTSHQIRSLGYEVKPSYDKSKKYKILLEPYPLIDDQLSYVFRIKYRYAPVSVKLDPVITPEWNYMYDAFIVYSMVDAALFEPYGRTHLVEYDKFRDFRRKESDGKPTLLYLPTFGSVSSIPHLNDSLVKQLKRYYKISIKAHHATQYRDSERDNLRILKKYADSYYDSNTSIVELLETADITLSDNSSAIFDSIYAEVPVVVFSKDKHLKDKGFGAINPMQYDLVKGGYILYSDNPKSLVGVINNTPTKRGEQKELKARIFGDSRGGASFIDIVKHYLSIDRVDDLYFLSKDIQRGQIIDCIRENAELKKDIESMRLDTGSIKGQSGGQVSRRVKFIKSLISRR